MRRQRQQNQGMMGNGFPGFWGSFGWLFGRGDRYQETIKHDKETQKEIPNARALFGGIGVAGFLCTLTGIWYVIARDAGDDVAAGLSIVGGIFLFLLGSVVAYRLVMDDDKIYRALWLFAGGLFCGLIGQLMGARMLDGWFREHIVSVLVSEVGMGAACGFYLLWTWHWREQHKPYEMLPMQRVLLQAIKPHLGSILSQELGAGMTPDELDDRLDDLTEDLREELIDAVSIATQTKRRPISVNDTAGVAVRMANEMWRADVLAFMVIADWVGTLSRKKLVDDRGGDNYYYMPSGNSLDKSRYRAIRDQLEGQRIIRVRAGAAPTMSPELSVNEVMGIVGDLACPTKMRGHYRS